MNHQQPFRKMKNKSNRISPAIQRSFGWLTLAVLFCVSCQTLDAQISINFDTDAANNPINAPAIFSLASPLTTLYSPLGVTFSGGGAILNESGSFGVSALSGDNFLAFNPTTYATGPETISFASPMSSVSIYAATSFSGEQFTMQAYSGADSLLGTDTVSEPAYNYEQLTVDSSTGISSVVLSVSGTAQSWVYDSLSATPVPEPSCAALLAIGLIGIPVYRWQRGKLSGPVS